jgi:nucleoside-diphosphate-sugar epimerase
MERLENMGNRIGGRLPGKPAKPGGESPFRRAAVLGATGSIGREITKELLNRGVPTRVVSRSLPSLRRHFAEGELELMAADLRDPAGVARAVEGCDMLFVCAGVKPEEYEHHVLMARNLGQAMTQARAKMLCVSPYWSMMCATIALQGRVLPGMPATHVSQLAKLRQIQEEILLNAGACVAQLPDFYGPGASVSLINDAIAATAEGKVAHWPGDPDACRDFLFVPDCGRPLVELAICKDARGQRLAMRGSGPIQPRLLLEAAAERLGEPLRLHGASLWMLKLTSRFSRRHRELVDLYPIYASAGGTNATAANHLIGEYFTTPHPLGVERTIRWMTGHADPHAAAA